VLDAEHVHVVEPCPDRGRGDDAVDPGCGAAAHEDGESLAFHAPSVLHPGGYTKARTATPRGVAVRVAADRVHRYSCFNLPQVLFAVGTGDVVDWMSDQVAVVPCGTPTSRTNIFRSPPAYPRHAA